MSEDQCHLHGHHEDDKMKYARMDKTDITKYMHDIKSAPK